MMCARWSLSNSPDCFALAIAPADARGLPFAFPTIRRSVCVYIAFELGHSFRALALYFPPRTGVNATLPNPSAIQLRGADPVNPVTSARDGRVSSIASL